MNRFLERAPSIQPAVKEMTSEELAHLTADFLSRGCQIAVCAQGETALPYGPAVRKTEVNARNARIEGLRRKAEKADAPLVEAIKKALETGDKSLVPKMPSSRLKRLVRVYFKDDARAQELLPVNPTAAAERRAQEAIKRIVVLRDSGMVGIKNIAAALDLQYDYVAKLNTQHQLGIPKASPGFRSKKA